MFTSDLVASKITKGLADKIVQNCVQYGGGYGRFRDNRLS